MTKKQQLYYLLEAFSQGQYDVEKFCKAFEEVFYPDVPYDELVPDELMAFEGLAEIVVRFSPFSEDLKAYPKVYRTEDEVRKAINATADKLMKK